MSAEIWRSVGRAFIIVLNPTVAGEAFKNGRMQVRFRLHFPKALGPSEAPAKPTRLAFVVLGALAPPTRDAPSGAWRWLLLSAMPAVAVWRARAAK